MQLLVSGRGGLKAKYKFFTDFGFYLHHPFFINFEGLEVFEGIRPI